LYSQDVQHSCTLFSNTKVTVPSNVSLPANSTIPKLPHNAVNIRAILITLEKAKARIGLFIVLLGCSS